jgi:hypothetical protein
LIKKLASNWERILFAIFGLTFFGFAFAYMKSSALPASSAAFGMGFLCFIFSSLARFKRFKGLGFEAELWEDKQKEAAELIEKLKGIVTIYSRETVMSRVKGNRLGGGAGVWKKHWEVFDELTSQHQALGQKVDFSELKTEVDTYFVFDMVLSLVEAVRRPIWDGREKARKLIDQEFGSPINDAEGYRLRLEQLNGVGAELKELFATAQQENLAAVVLNWASEAQRNLKTHFNIDIAFDEATLFKLNEVSKAYSNRPIKVTERLIALADRNFE